MDHREGTEEECQGRLNLQGVFLNLEFCAFPLKPRYVEAEAIRSSYLVSHTSYNNPMYRESRNNSSWESIPNSSGWKKWKGIHIGNMMEMVDTQNADEQRPSGHISWRNDYKQSTSKMIVIELLKINLSRTSRLSASRQTRLIVHPQSGHGSPRPMSQSLHDHPQTAWFALSLSGSNHQLDAPVRSESW